MSVFSQSLTYTDIHRRLLGACTSFLVPRPKDAVLKELECSIEEFLDRNDLRALKPIFFLLFTTQGFGYLNNTSSLYGLLWVTPARLASMIERLKVRKSLSQEPGQTQQRPADGDHPVTILVKGFQPLWKAMVERLHIQVVGDAAITRIDRSNGKVKIGFHQHHRPEKTLEETFDFLVIAAPIQNILPVLDVKEDERLVFSKVHTSSVVSTLVDFKLSNVEESPGIDNWFGNVHPDRELEVWSTRSSHRLLQDTSFRVNVDDEHLRTAVSYQYASHPLTKDVAALAEARLDSHLKQLGAQTITMVNQQAWSHFPHYSTADMSGGVLWDVLEMQGRHRTWYTGGWVCFDALNAIVSYNRMLVEVWEKLLREKEQAAEWDAVKRASQRVRSKYL